MLRKLAWDTIKNLSASQVKVHRNSNTPGDPYLWVGEDTTIEGLIVRETRDVMANYGPIKITEVFLDVELEAAATIAENDLVELEEEPEKYYVVSRRHNNGAAFRLSLTCVLDPKFVSA
jgi:hypothetical protein